jgi:hypothetical protein
MSLLWGKNVLKVQKSLKLCEKSFILRVEKISAFIQNISIL